MNKKKHEEIILNCRIFLRGKKLSFELIDTPKEMEKMNYLSEILERSQDLMFFKDKKLKYKYVNSSFANLFECDRDLIYNKSDRDILPEELYNQSERGDLLALENGYYLEIEYFKNRQYQVLKEVVEGGILGIAKDVTDYLKEKEKAEKDSLTTLYNRRKFMELVDEIYMKKEDGYMFLVMDLDDLRDLNNNFGHAKGDEYLKILGEILNTHSKKTFFRIGGDEFAALIKKTEDEVKEMLNSIFERLNNLRLYPKLTISVGGKRLDIKKEYSENYLEVDAILYQVKKKGKNNYLLK